MGFWSNLAGRILDPLGVHRVFEKASKTKLAISTRGFSSQSADRLYYLMVAAGKGNAQAKGQIDAIKAAAAKGDANAQKLLSFMGPIAKMVAQGMGPPSALQRRGGARGQQASRQQQAALAKAQREVQALRIQQAERAKRQAFQKQVAMRFKAEQEKWDAEAQQYEDKIAEIDRKLAEKDWDQKAREQLEAQAAAYEDLIAKIEAKKSGQPVPPVSPTDTSPDAAEGQAAMDQDAYPTGQGGAPGDTEFTP